MGSNTASSMLSRRSRAPPAVRAARRRVAHATPSSSPPKQHDQPPPLPSQRRVVREIHRLPNTRKGCRCTLAPPRDLPMRGSTQTHGARRSKTIPRPRRCCGGCGEKNVEALDTALRRRIAVLALADIGPVCEVSRHPLSRVRDAQLGVGDTWDGEDRVVVCRCARASAVIVRQ